MSDIPSPTHSLQEARFRQKSIGRALSQAYAGVTSEAPPEDFLDLLATGDRGQLASSTPRLAFPSTMQLSRPSSSL